MHARLLLLGLVALPSSGCDDPAAPSPPNLRVSVSTAGVDRDNSYTVRTGEGPARPVQAAIVLFLPPGDHDVVLDGVAQNCSVLGPDSVRVTVTLGQLAGVAFEVECRAVSGAVEVAAPASGRDFDPDGYEVNLDEVPTTRVYPRGSVVLDGVLPGTHVVRLDDFSSNCRLTGPPTRTVLVTAGGLTRDTVRVAFEGTCEAVTGDVEVRTATGGLPPDPNGYSLALAGRLLVIACGFYDYDCEPGAPLLIPPTGSYLIPQVPPGDHAVQLGDIASNCSVVDGRDRTVSVVVGELSVVRFDVTCQGP